MTSQDFQFERTHAGDEPAQRATLSFVRRTFPGLLAAAASAGVIVGDGWRSGTPLAPFVRLGATFFAARMSPLFPNGVHALIGLMIHTFWLVLWGLCFTAVARSLRGGKLFIAALIVTGALWVLAQVFPVALGAGELPFMSTAHAFLYLATIAAALSFGTRLARYA